MPQLFGSFIKLSKRATNIWIVLPKSCIRLIVAKNVNDGEEKKSSFIFYIYKYARIRICIRISNLIWKTFVLWHKSGAIKTWKKRKSYPTKVILFTLNKFFFVYRSKCSLRCVCLFLNYKWYNVKEWDYDLCTVKLDDIVKRFCVSVCVYICGCVCNLCAFYTICILLFDISLIVQVRPGIIL